VRLGLWLSLLAIAAWFGPTAHAQSLPLTLSWHAPKGCANKPEVLAELGRIARARPGRQIPALIADGRIVKVAGGYRLTLRTERDGRVGERTLGAAGCQALAREATLVLALAFGAGVELVEPTQPPPRETDASSASPGAAVAATPAPADRSPERQPVAEVPAAPAPATEAGAPEASPPEAEIEEEPDTHHISGAPALLRLAMFAGGGAVLRSLPSVAGTLLMGAELGFEHVYLQPRVQWLPGVAQAVGRGASARYTSLGGGLDMCAAVSALGVRFALCGGFEIASLKAEADGTDADRAQRAGIYAINVLLPVVLPAASRLALRLAPELQMTWSEPSFVVTGLGEVYRPARVRVGLSAALLLAL
jgi:hypothetical protein